MSKFKVGDRLVWPSKEDTVYTVSEVHPHTYLLTWEDENGAHTYRDFVWWVDDRCRKVTFPDSVDPRDATMRDFFDAALQRHEDSRKKYGYRSFENSTLETIQDIKEELLDQANYAAYQYAKILKLEEALKDLRDKLGVE